MSLLEMPTRQHTCHQDLHNSSVAVMLRDMPREVNTGRTSESGRHIDYFTNNHSFSGSASDLDCCFMAFLSRRKPT